MYNHSKIDKDLNNIESINDKASTSTPKKCREKPSVGQRTKKGNNISKTIPRAPYR